MIFPQMAEECQLQNCFYWSCIWTGLHWKIKITLLEAKLIKWEYSLFPPLSMILSLLTCLYQCPDFSFREKCNDQTLISTFSSTHSFYRKYFWYQGIVSMFFPLVSQTKGLVGKVKKHPPKSLAHLWDAEYQKKEIMFFKKWCILIEMHKIILVLDMVRI